ncbi:hypothetical protein PEC302107_08990 [Pectobacterium araliae]|uniref:Lipoprotein n=1 Tax=Pectobacterium araliae TaxID=3073862 RepID=A0AAN0K9U8_9GAMM|nr:hypothetical protein PEC302110_00570 [Pectobacterium sp. MAFF 302110]GKW19170.1 hypothetical protein PEC302107_08990 [Pectobacterium carotovorum subsp. carotovorum]
MKGMVAVLSLYTSFSCFAGEDYEMETCRNGGFSTYPGQYSVAKITAPHGDKVHFYDDYLREGCPEKKAVCQNKAYLIHGDKVLVAQEKNGWSCVGYFGQKSEFVGWMRSSYLEKQAIKTAGINAWLGSWRYYDTTIKITRGKNNTLRLKGNTTWYGGRSSYGGEIIHLGNISATAIPNGNRLQWGDSSEEFECSGVMQLINGYLIVEDNGQCGGMNVRFNDVYRLKI